MTSPWDHQNAFEGMNFTMLEDGTEGPDSQAGINFCTLNRCHPMRLTCKSYDGLRLISYGRWRAGHELGGGLIKDPE